MVSLLSIDTASNFGSICCSPGLDPNEVMYRGGTPYGVGSPKMACGHVAAAPVAAAGCRYLVSYIK